MSNEIEAPVMEQMGLIVDGQKLYIDRGEERRRYTGERFKERFPERYKAAVQLIASGQFGDSEIANFVHADDRTIAEVRLHQITDVSQQREILKQRYFVQQVVLGQRADELIPDCKDIKGIYIGQGISKDAYLAVSGLPTAKIEVNHHFDVGAELRKLNEEAREMIKKAKARVIDPAALEEGTATA